MSNSSTLHFTPAESDYLANFDATSSAFTMSEFVALFVEFNSTYI